MVEADAAPSAPPELGRRRLVRALVLGVVAAAVIYVGFGAWAGFREVAARLAHFRWSTALLGALLAAGNYFLRFLKWELYLARLGIRCPRLRSLGIFLAGFSLTVTPGKVGEVLKSYLLRESAGVPMARSAPIVVAERVSDLCALLLLSLVGVGGLGSSRRVLLAGAALVFLLMLFISSRTLGELVFGLCERLPVLGRLAPKLRDFHASARELHRPLPFLGATALSVAAWAAECLAFQFILGGFPGAELGLRLATFIYAAMTIAGALSFLPGGLGVTEGGMVALLVATARGVDQPTALAATFVTRLCTLWFAVALGLGALTLVGLGRPRQPDAARS